MQNTTAKAQAADDAAKKADEEAERKAHEAAEAKRKAEWETKQAAKKAAEQEQLSKLAAMGDDEVMMSSTLRIRKDLERLTRRNMKECVAEHIQTICLDDPAFARRVMHPRKSMIHCIWYINRKAKEFMEKGMKDNGFQPENGIYGSDIPDDLCYQWAVDYFNDPDAAEDQEKKEKFVPKSSTGSNSAYRDKGAQKKDGSKKSSGKPAVSPNNSGQMSLLEVAG